MSEKKTQIVYDRSLQSDGLLYRVNVDENSLESVLEGIDLRTPNKRLGIILKRNEKIRRLLNPFVSPLAYYNPGRHDIVMLTDPIWDYAHSQLVKKSEPDKYKNINCTANSVLAHEIGHAADLSSESIIESFISILDPRRVGLMTTGGYWIYSSIIRSIETSEDFMRILGNGIAYGVGISLTSKAFIGHRPEEKLAQKFADKLGSIDVIKFSPSE